MVEFQSISGLKEYVFGVEGIFLLEEKNLITSDFSDKDTRKTLKVLSYLVDIIREKRELDRLSIITNDKKLFVFIKENNFLGAVCKPNINFPLLKLSANRMLMDIKEMIKEEKTEESKKGEKTWTEVLMQ